VFETGDGATVQPRTVRLARRPGTAPAAQPASASGHIGDAGVYQSPPKANSLPIQDDWGAIARIYDLEHPACRGAELAFWQRQALINGGNVLELASGSGRIAIPLARRGCTVTGLELSDGMLSRARVRTAHQPADTQARLEWVRADMSRFELPGQRFGLVFVAYNSFWLLDDLAAQASCLQCVARHLEPHGRLALDLFPPNEEDRQSETGIAQHLALRRHGRRLLRLKDYEYDERRGVGLSTVRYYAEPVPSGGTLDLLAMFRYPLRIADPPEVEALLAANGFTVETRYGSYRCEPLTPDSPRAIFIARPAAPAACGG
jgi:SAM-dependent methyltransferase